MPTNLPVDRFLDVELMRWRDPRSGRFTAGTKEARKRIHELAVDAGALLVAELARQSPRSRIHRGTGKRFAESWRAQVTGAAAGETVATLHIDNTSPQRGFVLFPTRAHGPVRAKVLHWIDDEGHDVWARRVKGTPANDVLGRVMHGASGRLRDALHTTTQQVRQTITDVWQ